jgi:capsid portal protein
MKIAKGAGQISQHIYIDSMVKRKALRLCPQSKVAAKENLLKTKNIRCDDMLAARRVPPQIMEIMPRNSA